MEMNDEAKNEAAPAKPVKVKLNKGVHHIHKRKPCEDGAILEVDAARARRMVDQKKIATYV
jgi:hypothetical protein